MYGTGRLPGIEAGATNRLEGTIWRGSPEALAFEKVKVGGGAATAQPLPLGSVVVEDTSKGYFMVLAAASILAATGLPGTRVGVVAEAYAKTGTTVTTPGATEDDDDVVTENTETVLVGIRGEVDKARLLIGDTAFTELTVEQQANLSRQLIVWGIIPVDVEQC